MRRIGPYRLFTTSPSTRHPLINSSRVIKSSYLETKRLVVNKIPRNTQVAPLLSAEPKPDPLTRIRRLDLNRGGRLKPDHSPDHVITQYRG